MMYAPINGPKGPGCISFIVIYSIAFAITRMIAQWVGAF